MDRDSSRIAHEETAQLGDQYTGKPREMDNVSTFTALYLLM